MQLSFSPTSPFVRKVLVVAHECGLSDQVTPILVNFRDERSGYISINPLGKVPALTLDDGIVLVDSPVICEYLDSLHPREKLFPPVGLARWRALQLQAIADGISDAGVLRFMEQQRAEDKRSGQFDKFQTRKQARSLDWLEAHADWLVGPVTIGQVAVGCMLRWLDFRYTPLDWRASHPSLARWYVDFALRPAMVATEFKDG